MIRPMNRMNRLGGLFSLARFQLFFLSSSGKPLLLIAVVRTGLFLVLLTLVAVEEQNLLRVGRTHTDSLRIWRVVVKRTTLQTRGQQYRTDEKSSDNYGA
jgi:hypothetical protein